MNQETTTTNPYDAHCSSITYLAKSLWRNRQLVVQMTKREVVGRYKGSMIGLIWSFLNPVFMLAIYTFFFSIVFKSRWQGGGGSKSEFALILFSGLMAFNLFAECINRAPTLVLSNVNYVKKIIFPLEILPVISLGSAFFHLIMSFSVWIIFYVIFLGIPSTSVFELPLVFIPLLLLTLGLSWFIASLGVYLRDLSQFVGPMTTALMFLSPVFYPINTLPEGIQKIVRLNPITYTVEQARNTMIWGIPIDLTEWTILVTLSLAIAWLGFAWFQKTRKGFSDVL
jgi:lipopolysaccharide transport system permease protein